MRYVYKLLIPTVLFFIISKQAFTEDTKTNLQPTQDDRKWFFLKSADIVAGSHHMHHAEIFGKYVSGYNIYILQGIDKAQSHAMNGGGYFIGIKAVPTESPIGYELSLFGKSLLKPPRTSSYCSGASYTAFIEGLNLIYPDGARKISDDRYEALRMQEPDGGRREDNIKYWGYWNADGFGSDFALVQYSGMGKEIKPQDALPGDFMNISWKKGGGHSVVFLGWFQDKKMGKRVMYWASQPGTNGMGDQLVSLDRIKEVKIVRLTQPDNLFSFNVTQSINHNIPGDTIHW